jgi:YD repeat-containing protein
LTTYGAVTYSYTANGDLQTATSGGETSTYNYDVFGNLTSVTLPNGTQIEYVIDGQNRRIGKKVNGNLVQSFVYSGRLRIAAELDGTGTVVSQFVYGIRHNVPDYMLKECAEWGTLHPDDPCATLPLARPRQPRRDPFRTSSGTLGPALRPGASTGALHAVIVRGLEQRAGFRDARHRGACVAPRTARAAAR